MAKSEAVKAARMEKLRPGHVKGTATARDVYECPTCHAEFALLRHGERRSALACPKCGWDGSFICHTDATQEKASDGVKLFTPSAVGKRKTLSQLVKDAYGIEPVVSREPAKGIREDGSYTVTFVSGGKTAKLTEWMTPDGITDRIEATLSDDQKAVPDFETFRAAEEWAVDWLKGN